MNLHSSIHANKLVSHGDFVNPRTFELAAMGVFQLVDKRQLMPEHFTCSSLKNPREDAELAVFDSMEELQENILFYLKHPDLREKIAQNAQKRVTSEHTYIHRMKTLLQHIKENSQDFPKKTAEFQWDDAITPETREEITALLQELNLAPNVDFETVIQCLRKKTPFLRRLKQRFCFCPNGKNFITPDERAFQFSQRTAFALGSH